MELWHAFYAPMNYAPATFWYARPGATCVIQPDLESARMPVAKETKDV